jgi:hypothetical protein
MGGHALSVSALDAAIELAWAWALFAIRGTRGSRPSAGMEGGAGRSGAKSTGVKRVGNLLRNASGAVAPGSRLPRQGRRGGGGHEPGSWVHKAARGANFQKPASPVRSNKRVALVATQQPAKQLHCALRPPLLATAPGLVLLGAANTL